MLDVWLPGAHRDPGRNAGYNSGRSQMRRPTAHYTVGSDSRNVGRNGYFHFLVHRDASRENGCTQYAEVDAVTWHAANAGNPFGPGVEWERLVTGGINDEGLSDAEPLTPNQLAWGTRLIKFFAEWGIPAQLYSGPRYQAGGWDGWVNHQAIDAARSDGLLRSEFAAMVGAALPPIDFEAIKRALQRRRKMLLIEADGLYLLSGEMLFTFPNAKDFAAAQTAGIPSVKWSKDTVTVFKAQAGAR